MVAIVPILLAVSILQWALMFFGGEINNLHHITSIYHTKNIHKLLITDLLERRMILIKEGKSVDEANLIINKMINEMIVKNKIKIGR